MNRFRKSLAEAIHPIHNSAMIRTIALAALLLATAQASAMPNPAAVYCIGQGGRLETVRNDKGEDAFCILPDGRRIEIWEFFRANHPQNK